MSQSSNSLPRLRGTLPSSKICIRVNIFSVFFCAHFLRLPAAHQFWSHSLSRITTTFSAPNHDLSLPTPSSHHVTSSHMSLFTIFTKFFDKSVGPAHLPCLFMYLLLLPHLIHRYLSAVETPLRSMLHALSFRVYENPLFLWLGA